MCTFGSAATLLDVAVIIGQQQASKHRVSLPIIIIIRYLVLDPSGWCNFDCSFDSGVEE